MAETRDQLLALVPAYRRGEISPSRAARIARLLEEDRLFHLDAEREMLVVEALAELETLPLPRGLLERSVKRAVGRAAVQRWFSTDNLLIALGVGIGCGGAAHLLAGRINIIPTFGRWLGELAGVAAGGSFADFLGAVGLLSLGILSAAAWYVVRLFRS